MMKFWKLVPLLFAAMLAGRGLKAAATQPNIIFFLTDDQRFDTLGCAGHPIIKTPTIDHLAAEGVLFANTFVQVPICAASRSTLFTGVAQRTHGYNFGEPTVPAALVATSYPVQLRNAGYRTGFAGKYGVSLEEKPAVLFDSFVAIDRNPYLKKQPDGTTRHETELCGDAAISFIESNPADKPFCLSISFNAAHAEDGDHRPGYHFQWPACTDGMYEDAVVAPPRLGDDRYFKALPDFLQDPKELSRQRYFWRWDTPEKYTTNMRAYFRMISGIDMTISRVLKSLEARGLADNTVIVYSADNGYMMGDRGLAGKWNPYEQSLRVPLIIFDPRVPKEKRGRTDTHMVSNMDIPATLLAAAGVPIPAAYQGRSLTPIVNGESPATWRDDVFCQHFFKRYPNWHAVRSERYKYAVYYDRPEGPYEQLFDLQKDGDEVTNLTANPEYATILSEMRQRLKKHLDETPERPAPPPRPAKK